MKELTAGFHPARGCIARLKEHQEQIDTDFQELRARFAKGFPGPTPGPSRAHLNALLACIIQDAPRRLIELKQQLAECLYWELHRHGEHLCAGYDVSERTIRNLYQLAA
jgi:hypothetical protein